VSGRYGGCKVHFLQQSAKVYHLPVWSQNFEWIASCPSMDGKGVIVEEKDILKVGL